MKNKKKILSLIACLSLLSSCSNGTSSNSTSSITTSTPTSVVPTPEPEVINPFDYAETNKTHNDTLNITSFNSSLTDEMKLKITELIIPEEINGVKVTSIGTPANVYLANISILKGFNNLRKIFIPKSIDNIYCNTNEYYRNFGGSAFAYLPSLESIEVDPENTNFSVLNVDINGETVSSNCLISNNDKNIICGWKNVLIPSDVKSVRINAFSHNESITSITLNENIQTITKYSLLEIDNLEKIELNGNKKYQLEGNVLYDNSNIYVGYKDIIIPNSFASLGTSKATGSNFAYCTSITSITIPEGSKLTSISDIAFGYLPKLNEIKVLDVNSKFKCTGNCLYDSESKEIIAGYNDVTLPLEITEIKSSSFNYNYTIKSLYIHEFVNSCNSYGLFKGVNNNRELKDLVKVTVSDKNTYLSYKNNCLFKKNNDYCDLIYAIPDENGHIQLPNEITRVSTTAFNTSTNPSIIKSIYFNEGITDFGSDLFSSESQIVELELPSTLQSIAYNSTFGYYGLQKLRYLEKVTIRNGDNQYFKIEGNCLINKATNLGGQTPIVLGWGDVIIPKSITNLGKGAFYMNYSVKTITWNKNIASFGSDLLQSISSYLKAINYIGTVDDIKQKQVFADKTLVDYLNTNFKSLPINFLDDDNNIVETHLVSELVS